MPYWIPFISTRYVIIYAQVLTDDAEHCEVNVRLIAEKESADIEEFPMCECLGGDGGYAVETVKQIPIGE